VASIKATGPVSAATDSEARTSGVTAGEQRVGSRLTTDPTQQSAISAERPIESIRIGERHRRDLGDKNPIAINPLDLLHERCRTLVSRVQAGELPFIEAVDFAYSAACFAGLVDCYGDDAIQQVLARAFVGAPKDGIDMSNDDVEHADINVTLCREGTAAVRKRHDKAQRYQPNGGDGRRSRFKLVPFDKLIPATTPSYLVHGILPCVGLVVIWGLAKCGKSFFTFWLMMHVALGWKFRDRRVQGGPVVYCAFEGAHGFGARAEAFRRKHPPDKDVPFYLVPARMNMVRDHPDLIAAIKKQLGYQVPVAVVLDTLNRSLSGSESNDEDMTAYIHAADAVREIFNCVVVIVHHCGINEKRPRGHTSLTGAVDAQLSVKRDSAGTIEVMVEYMKDGPEGEKMFSRLESVDVGADDNGEPITSCVLMPVELSAVAAPPEPKLPKNQQTMFTILHDAGANGLSTKEWDERARKVGIGVKRRPDLYDIRSALKAKDIVRQYGDRWTVNHTQ
jgi:hypothetical protein